MKWTILLEDENKKKITSISKELEVINLDKNFILLKYLDPYGDTTFNKLQMDDLMTDFINLKNEDKNPLIHEIILLVSKCKLSPHTYLTFYGN